MTTFVRILALTALLPAGWAGESFAPKPFAAERYRHLWEKSPFVTESAALPSSGSLSQRFVLTGVASLGDKPVIFVLDRASLTRMLVSTEKNALGLELVSVASHHDPRQASATIRLGADQAVIQYDPAALQNVNPPPEPSKTAQASAPATSAQPTPPNRPPVPVKRVIRKDTVNLTINPK